MNCIDGGSVSLWLWTFSFVGGRDSIKWKENCEGGDERLIGFGCDQDDDSVQYVNFEVEVEIGKKTISSNPAKLFIFYFWI